MEGDARPSLGAVIFDLDGVITDSAKLHAWAWKTLFDEFLRRNRGPEFVPFDTAVDYPRWVDGKPRYEGVESFLVSRGFEIPHGTPADAEDKDTHCGLGNRKNRFFKQRLSEDGVEVFTSSVEFIDELKRRKIPVGLVTSSKNRAAILKSAGLQGLFDAEVDGIEVEKLGLRGKPAPDPFLCCAERMRVSPLDCVVFEDAASGVEAGVTGNFGFVVGIDRHGEADLLSAGANIVIGDLGELSVDSLVDLWQTRRSAAPRAC